MVKAMTAAPGAGLTLPPKGFDDLLTLSRFIDVNRFINNIMRAACYAVATKYTYWEFER